MPFLQFKHTNGKKIENISRRSPYKQFGFSVKHYSQLFISKRDMGDPSSYNKYSFTLQPHLHLREIRKKEEKMKNIMNNEIEKEKR